MTAEAPRPSTPGGWVAPPSAPTGPSAGLRYAGFWVRVVAYILDVIVIVVLSTALWVVRSLLRYVGLIISFAVLFLGVIWVGFDRRKQGWHDKIAATVVVRPT